MERDKTTPAAETENGQDVQLKKRRCRRIRALRSLLLRTALLVAVVYILLFHIVGLTAMPREDMTPRLDAGDMLLFYRLDKAPKARDIVVIDKAVQADYSAMVSAKEEDPGLIRKTLNWLGFRDPDAPPKQRFVCRVVACPGDTVEITEERGLIINGNPVIEANIFASTLPYAGYVEYPVRLGAGEYFVLADTRNGGVDSRNFGPVTEEEIQGIVITVLRRSNL